MNAIKTVNSIIKDDLCTGCGACVGLCPLSAIEMVNSESRGIYVPWLNEGKCDECGVCFEVCPGHTVDFRQLNSAIFGKQPEDILLGNYLKCRVGHAADHEVRYNSASGGLVTALLIFALEERIIDGALVTRMNPANPLEPQPFIARTRAEIISASRSKYCPVPANIALREILNSVNGGKIAAVGLPCHIQAIRKAELINKRLMDNIVLHFGILCGHTDSFLQIDYLLKKYGIRKEDVLSLNYRGEGWPGYLTITTKNKVKIAIPYNDYIYLHALRFFIPHRCLYCCDACCELGDITFADAWLKHFMENDNIGTSIMITRTAIGDQLCIDALKEGAIIANSIDVGDVILSQHGMNFSRIESKLIINLFKLFNSPVPTYTLEFAKPKVINYIRMLIILLNHVIGSKKYLNVFIEPVAKIERIF